MIKIMVDLIFCDRIISDCKCDDHNDHWSYDNPNTYKYNNDDTCNDGKVDD